MNLVYLSCNHKYFNDHQEFQPRLQGRGGKERGEKKRKESKKKREGKGREGKVKIEGGR